MWLPRPFHAGTDTVMPWVRQSFPLLMLLCLAGFCRGELPRLAASELDWLGARIYASECSSQPDCLVSWNAGEEFPSLGIGHFIWYRAGQQGPFTETFPDLLRHLQASGVRLPDWLQPPVSQPWPDRSSFLTARQQPRLRELQALLEASQREQAAFIVARFSRSAGGPQWLAAPTQWTKLQAVGNAAPPYGLYALIDYVHFKGEGTNPTERYGGEGWGLWQVLEAMPTAGEQPLDDFVSAASQVLARRVANAPPERNEQRWLAGWQKRVAAYLPPTSAGLR